MLFLCFDERNTRSERIQADKFTLVSYWMSSCSQQKLDIHLCNTWPLNLHSSMPPGTILSVWQKCYHVQLFYLSRIVSGTEGQENKPSRNCQSHQEGEKVNKNVILLSSLHLSVNIAENEKKTPETIQYYNATKFGVDIMDQMRRKYSVKSSSRHWPVHVFFNMLDSACINAWIFL
ncbi:hypothetical protein PR048_006709 [Dryococelus australis]|uniref:PiggyBac transposable element-derived protein domain-containing protein n=1 Tax=Dryococelus australis TaxID=614101 RepID=A0ABQ9ICY2_9NEOP|nr:hypothetical protein PR048_006709 [Dryococelus australis]